jgi:hypothetical protein
MIVGPFHSVVMSHPDPHGQHSISNVVDAAGYKNETDRQPRPDPLVWNSLRPV